MQEAPVLAVVLTPLLVGVVREGLTYLQYHAQVT